jgi:hypothetical protein
MFPSSLAIALTGLALGLLALGAFAWGWRQGQFSHLRARREVFKYGGIGGLVGLSLSALVSLGIVAMPGFAPPGIIAVVQLLGPNIGTSPRVAYRGNRESIVRQAAASVATNTIV